MPLKMFLRRLIDESGQECLRNNIIICQLNLRSICEVLSWVKWVRPSSTLTWTSNTIYLSFTFVKGLKCVSPNGMHWTYWKTKTFIVHFYACVPLSDSPTLLWMYKLWKCNYFLNSTIMLHYISVLKVLSY